MYSVHVPNSIGFLMRLVYRMTNNEKGLIN